MRKFLKTVLFLFALSSIAYAEDDAIKEQQILELTKLLEVLN